MRRALFNIRSLRRATAWIWFGSLRENCPSQIFCVSLSWNEAIIKQILTQNESMVKGADSGSTIPIPPLRRHNLLKQPGQRGQALPDVEGITFD